MGLHLVVGIHVDFAPDRACSLRNNRRGKIGFLTGLQCFLVDFTMKLYV